MAIIKVDPTKAGVLPEGTYKAFIAKYEQKTSEKGNTYYNIEFELHGNKQYDGRKVWQNYGVDTSFFCQLLTAIGFNHPEDQEFQFDDRYLGGKHCQIKVFHEEYEASNGQKKQTAKVSDVMPLDGAAPESEDYVSEEDMPF